MIALFPLKTSGFFVVEMGMWVDVDVDGHHWVYRDPTPGLE